MLVSRREELLTVSPLLCDLSVLSVFDLCPPSLCLSISCFPPLSPSCFCFKKCLVQPPREDRTMTDEFVHLHVDFVGALQNEQYLSLGEEKERGEEGKGEEERE